MTVADCLEEKYELARDVVHMTGREGGLYKGRSTRSYTSGLARAPVDFYGPSDKKVDLHYYSGQVGLRWDTVNKELSVAWGWCVTSYDEASVKKKMKMLSEEKKNERVVIYEKEKTSMMSKIKKKFGK